MRHVAGRRAHELRDDRAGPAGEQDLGVAAKRTVPAVSCSTSCRTAPTAPQNSPDRIAATVAVPKAGGGSASSAMSICGRRSVNSCSALADMAMPGRIAPPTEGAVGIDQIDRDGRAGIDDDRRVAGRPQAIRRQGVQQPIDADHVGPRQLDHQRQIAEVSNMISSSGR